MTSLCTLKIMRTFQVNIMLSMSTRTYEHNAATEKLNKQYKMNDTKSNTDCL